MYQLATTQHQLAAFTKGGGDHFGGLHNGPGALLRGKALHLGRGQQDVGDGFGGEVCHLCPLLDASRCALDRRFGHGYPWLSPLRWHFKDTQMIRKAIFPVGGLGTRFLPATKAMPSATVEQE